VGREEWEQGIGAVSEHWGDNPQESNIVMAFAASPPQDAFLGS